MFVLVLKTVIKINEINVFYENINMVNDAVNSRIFHIDNVYGMFRNSISM